MCLFYGGRAENTRKIVVTCAALEQLTWFNESTFKFNDYATQLINHSDTLERGGQAKSDQEKVMKLLNSMNTSNVVINTRIELNRQGVSFQDAIVALSTSIASIYLLIGMKGRKALVSETNTGGGGISHKSHLNGVSFTESDWKRNFKSEDYKCIPNQVRKLIGFAKYHKYDEKHAAFLAESKEKRRKKRGRNVSETNGQFDDPDDAIVDPAIYKIL